MDATKSYQMTIICAMIMLGFIGGANLLLAAFIGKVESREMLEVLLLLLEALLIGAIVFLIQKTAYHGDMQTACTQIFSKHKLASCIVLIAAGLIVLIASTVLSVKMVQKKRA